MHHTVLQTPGILGKSPTGRTTGITRFVYESVRGITRLVGGGVDALLGILAPLADRPSSDEREAILAALNGIFGDYLVASGNPLAVPMQLRKGGVPVAVNRAALATAFRDPGRKIVVLVHGLCMNDLQWARKGHDHGAALAHDLGYAPVYLHYNTGLHVSTNGRQFGALMEMLLRQWPEPVERLTIIGHSMGGLVARSACIIPPARAMPGRSVSANLSSSGLLTLARRLNVPAPGWTFCWRSARTRRRLRAWGRFAVPGSRTCDMGMCAMKTGKRIPRRPYARPARYFRYRREYVVMRLPRASRNEPTRPAPGSAATGWWR
jgi:pimeloyl-ACP methyl ester carboxylesterase